MTLTAIGSFMMPALPALGQTAQEPKGEVMVPQPSEPAAKTGVYYTEIAPLAPCPPAGGPVLYIPETYNNFDADKNLVERGTRGPFADSGIANPLFGSHKIWTPAGAWNDRMVTLYPLPLVIQPHLCLYDGAETGGCSKNCPDSQQGLQFSYPKYNLENRYEPNKLPHAECTQPGAFQRVMEFKPTLTAWAGDYDGAAKGSYRLPYHDICIKDSSQYCTVKREAIYSIKSWSDWAASFTLHADNNPADKPGLYDISCSFAEGSPLVFLEFSDALPRAVLSFDMAPKMNAIDGDHAGQPFLQFPDGCTVSPKQKTPDCGSPVVTCAQPAGGQVLLHGRLFDFAGEKCLAGVKVWLNEPGQVDLSTVTDETGYYCFVLDERPCDTYTVIADKEKKSGYCFPEAWKVCPGGKSDVEQNFYAGGQPEHTFGFILPHGATQSVSGNGIVIDFGTQQAGGKWVVAILMPDVPSGKEKKAFWTSAFKAMLDGGGAYGIPRDSARPGHGSGTAVDPWPPQYDEASRAVTTTFTFTPSSPVGLTPAKSAVLSGLFPHQWRGDRGNSTTASILKVGDDELVYTTGMGKLKLASAEVGGNGRASFQTCMTFPGILPELPKVSNDLGLATKVQAHFNDVALKDALAFEISYPWDRWASYPGTPDPVDPFKNNTYDTGKIMGERAVLARVAKNLGGEDLFKSATTALKRDLESWLGGGKFPDDSGTQNFLYYDGAWGMLIGYPAAYYSEAHTTDLHFHYGYWIRSAAEIARQDKGWIPKWGPMVNLLAKTIANRERTAPSPADSQNPAMPFLALFDPYQGHSWAKGMPDTKIDQESSSEAMNAWTGLILWGQVWGQAQDPPDFAMRDLGIWMYTTEMNSIYNYWFDVYKQVLPPEWGSRGSYSKPAQEGAPAYAPLPFQPIVNPHESALTTNFGMHPDFLSAINWLPFHGGSFYLSSDDKGGLGANFQSQLAWAYWNQQYLGADTNWEPKGCLSTDHATTSCGKPNHPFCPKSGWSDGWAERMFMFGSMQGISGEFNSERALAEMVASQTAPQPPANNPPLMASGPDLGDSISNAYYWLYNMRELGVRMEGVTANSPFAMAFFNDGTQDKTAYVAWNPGTADGPYKNVTFRDASGKTLYEMKGLTNDEVRVTVVPRLPGDGNGDGAVNIAEVQQSINMFLGTQEPGNGADCDLDDSVEIHELQKVINAFLGLPSSC